MPVFSLDLRSLALFRIGIGLLICIDAICRLTELTTYYSESGVLPQSALAEIVPARMRMSLYFLSTSPTLASALLVATILFGALLCLGLRSQLASVACWILIVSVHARNPMILDRGDMLLRVMLFWGIFLPLGSYWSLDSRRSARSPLQSNLQSHGQNVAVVTGLPIVFFILQFTAMYFYTVIFKTNREWLVDRTAVYYALNIEYFQTAAAQFLLQFPALMRALTIFSYIVEALCPLLLFIPKHGPRFRLILIPLFFGLHLGFSTCLKLGLFTPIVLTTWLALLPSLFWERALGARQSLVGPLPSRPTVNVLLGLAFGFVVVWNQETLRHSPPEPYDIPQPVQQLGQVLYLDQIWNMFAPYPLRKSGWYVAAGSLSDGTQVDILHDGAPLTDEKPALVSRDYSNQRSRKFFQNLAHSDYAVHRARYAQYLCKRWNSSNPTRHANSVELLFYSRWTRPPETPATVKRKSFARVDCP